MNGLLMEEVSVVVLLQFIDEIFKVVHYYNVEFPNFFKGMSGKNVD